MHYCTSICIRAAHQPHAFDNAGGMLSKRVYQRYSSLSRCLTWGARRWRNIPGKVQLRCGTSTCVHTACPLHFTCARAVIGAKGARVKCGCHLRMPHPHVFEAVRSRVYFQPTFSTFFQSDSYPMQVWHVSHMSFVLHIVLIQLAAHFSCAASM